MLLLGVEQALGGISSKMSISGSIAQPCEAALSRSSPSVSDRLMYSPRSSRRAPSSRNCRAIVVLPVPGLPSRDTRGRARSHRRARRRARRCQAPPCLLGGSAFQVSGHMRFSSSASAKGRACGGDSRQDGGEVDLGPGEVMRLLQVEPEGAG